MNAPLNITNENRAKVAILAAQLSNIACDVDGMRRDFAPHPVWFADLTQAVDLLHGVAMDCDNAFKLALYASDDDDADEVQP
jgi:hypothetical protein